MKRENLKNLSQSSLLNLLSEESGLICSYLKVFLFLNAAFVLVDAAVFVSVLAVPGFYIEGNGWGNFLAQLLGGLFIVQDGDGAHISYLALLLCAVSKILPNLITCYVFLALLRMFEKIKTGRTPFTELSSRMWRNSLSHLCRFICFGLFKQFYFRNSRTGSPSALHDDISVFPRVRADFSLWRGAADRVR